MFMDVSGYYWTTIWRTLSPPWTVSGVEAPAQVAGKASLTTQAAVAAGNRELAVFLELPFPLWAWLLRIAAR
jgi:hypothetical protein